MKRYQTAINVLLIIDIMYMLLVGVFGIFGSIYSIDEFQKYMNSPDNEPGKTIGLLIAIIFFLILAVDSFISITIKIIALVMYNSRKVIPLPIGILTIVFGGIPLGLIAGILMLVERRNINNHNYY